MVVSSLYVRVEGVGGGHISEVRSTSCIDVPPLSSNDNLCQLSPGHVVPPPERTVRVPGYDRVVVSSLYVLIESATLRHIREVRTTACIDGPAFSQGDNLSKLASCGLHIGAECVIGVARYYSSASQAHYLSVQVVVRWYVTEVRPARHHRSLGGRIRSHSGGCLG